MKETILNQIILKTGDTIQIQEPYNLPMSQKIMYKIEHEKDKVVVHSKNGNIVIPVENILFATSVHLMMEILMKSNFEIKINKEIRDYTESILLGLSLRQTIFSILACAVACGLYFLFKERFGTEVTSWLCMLGAAPFAALGFIKFQGMYTEDIVKMAISSFVLSTRNLINVPFNLYYEILEPFINQSRKESIVHDKKLRKIEKAQQRKNKSA